MHGSPHGFFHLDAPAAGAVVPAGPVNLRGWAAAQKGLPFVDLKIRVGSTFRAVVHGFPRADLAAHFGLRDPFLPGGFEATVVLPAGEHDLTFAALDLAGQWRDLATVRISATGPSTAPAPEGHATMRPAEFAKAMRCVLRQARTGSLTKAVDELVAAIPSPGVLRYPHAPLHGHLDRPMLLEQVLFGQLRVEGWLFHETLSVRRVIATVDLQTWQELEIGLPSSHVGKLFPGVTAAGQAGMVGLIDIPAQLPTPLCFRTYAELADGSWHLCQVLQSHVWDQEEAKSPFANFGRATFARAAWLLRHACQQRGLLLPWSRLFWDEMLEVYREYERRAPRERTARPQVLAMATTSGPPLRHATLVTHNLNYEGAPLILCELARHLIRTGVRVEIVSAQTGALAPVCVEMGATVRVVDTTALTQTADTSALRSAIDQLTRQLPLADTDLVVANTLSAYWAVHLARRARRPSLCYIHESTTPASFFFGHMSPGTLPLIEETFRLATHVSFSTDTTRHYYRPWLGDSNHSVNPHWIDVGMIDRYRSAHSRDILREQLGVTPDTRLVVNVGTVCNRKGQHVFARSVDLLWRRQPELAASSLFLMVGGNDSLFDVHMQRLLAQLNRPNLRVVATTQTPLAYFGAADLFVCSSYEESFPRVVMEAMACEVPIVSTDVHGIRDMLESGRHGMLVRPGETHSLAEGMAQMLTEPARGRAYASLARSRVLSQFNTDVTLPRHAALATAVSQAASF